MRVFAIVLLTLGLIVPVSSYAAENGQSYRSSERPDGPRPGQEWPFSYPYYGAGLCTLKCGDMLKVCTSYATNAWGVGDCKQRHSVCEGDCSIHDGPRRP